MICCNHPMDITITMFPKMMVWEGDHYTKSTELWFSMEGSMYLYILHWEHVSKKMCLSISDICHNTIGCLILKSLHCLWGHGVLNAWGKTVHMHRSDSLIYEEVGASYRLLWYLNSWLDCKRGVDSCSIAPDAVNSHELLQHLRVGQSQTHTTSWTENLGHVPQSWQGFHYHNTALSVRIPETPRVFKHLSILIYLEEHHN